MLNKEREQEINFTLSMIQGILEETEIRIEIVSRNNKTFLVATDTRDGKQYAILNGGGVNE